MCDVCSGDPAVGHHATGCAGGDPPLHERARAYPGQEGGADPGGYPPVLRAGRARGQFLTVLAAAWGLVTVLLRHGGIAFARLGALFKLFSDRLGW